MKPHLLQFASSSYMYLAPAIIMHIRDLRQLRPIPDYKTTRTIIATWKFEIENVILYTTNEEPLSGGIVVSRGRYRLASLHTIDWSKNLN